MDDDGDRWIAELAAQHGLTPDQVRAIDPQMTIEPRCLYPDEGALALVVLGSADKVRWRQVVAQWELQGFPQKDPTTGRRFWPSVARWLDLHNGLADGPAPVRDGEENFR